MREGVIVYFAPFCVQKPMALHIVHSNSEKFRSSLALWSDDLPPAQLESMLPKAEITNYGGQHFRLEKRRKEWLRTRILLDHLAPGSPLSFLSNGKPVLSEKMHVSISHSGQVAAVVIANQAVGLDVQPIDPKLSKICSRFCNERDLALLNAGEVDHRLAMIWGAKEAVFKYYGERVDFAGEMTMLPFSIHDDKIRLAYQGRHGSGMFELGHLYWMEQHILYTTSFATSEGGLAHF
jgi:4'-phosphopantetheinyl transferase